MLTIDQLKIKFLNREKKFVDKKSPHSSSFYWVIFIYIIFIAFMIALCFGYYLFMQINKEMSISVYKENYITGVISKERIDKALEYFKERENKSNIIINSPAPVVDPSL